MNKWNPRANEIFAQAVDIPNAANRQRFLDEQCGHHDLLRRDVESLLLAFEEDPTFLNAPLVKRSVESDSLAETLTGNLKVRLIDVDASAVDSVWQFAPQTVQIGRSSSNDIQLRDMHVSRHHATLRHDGSRWVCAHVGRTGVFHLGCPVTEINLADGMILQFSSCGPKLQFQHNGAKEKASSSIW